MLEDWDGDDETSTITAADDGADTVTIAGHEFVTGDGPVRAAGADLPAGLATGTDYWIVVVSASLVKLATSYANASAEIPTVVDLTDAGSGAMTLTHPDFAEQRRCIVRASDYIDVRHGPAMRGVRASDDQGLELPRADAYDANGYALNGVPVCVKRAAAEYAHRIRTTTSTSTSPLLPDPGTNARIVQQTKTLGPLSKSTSWASGTPTVPEYPFADGLLRPILRPKGQVMRA